MTLEALLEKAAKAKELAQRIESLQKASKFDEVGWLDRPEFFETGKAAMIKRFTQELDGMLAGPD